MTESDFLNMVLQLAKLRGWRTLHVRPARTATGWRTPVQGDGKGFLDVLALRRDQVLALELKVGNNQLTHEQRAWLDALQAAGIPAYVVKPDDWPFIESVLEHGPITADMAKEMNNWQPTTQQATRSEASSKP